VATVTVATFNCENLFARFKFKGKRVKQGDKYVYRPWTKEELADIADKGFDVDLTKFESLTGEMRTLTAQAIYGTDADVIALQEVESLETLKIFNSRHLNKSGYKYKILIDGNDPRLIDVAVLSRFPFSGLMTYQFRRTENNKAYIFSRDCLEVGVRVTATKQLTLFANHFKSMLGGRPQTMNRRKVQSEEVVKILKERFGANPGTKDWVVLGDLNDYIPTAGLAPLLDQPWLENVVQTRISDESERWTHYWDEKEEYQQLDYILLSKSLADKNPGAVPAIERRGLPRRAERYAGERFEGVGQNRPKASDHCPVSIKLKL
jgi:predicted extracellular nuclease